MNFDKLVVVILILVGISIPAYIDVPLVTGWYQSLYAWFQTNQDIFYALIIIAALLIPRFIDFGGLSDFLKTTLGLIVSLSIIVLIPSFLYIPYLTAAYSVSLGWIIAGVNVVAVTLRLKKA